MQYNTPRLLHRRPPSLSAITSHPQLNDQDKLAWQHFLKEFMSAWDGLEAESTRILTPKSGIRPLLLLLVLFFCHVFTPSGPVTENPENLKNPKSPKNHKNHKNIKILESFQCPANSKKIPKISKIPELTETPKILQNLKKSQKLQKSWKSWESQKSPKSRKH